MGHRCLIYHNGGDMKYFALTALLIACEDKSEDSAESEESEEVSEESE
tara:strand:- start:280 stop:423 length:144 start_codon:yes stop_codon:yes gene_type:complete